MTEEEWHKIADERSAEINRVMVKLDSALTNVARLRAALDALWKIVPPHKVHPQLVKQVQEALSIKP